MDGSGFEPIEFVECTPRVARERMWVAVRDGREALSVFVAYAPAPGATRMYDLITYTVESEQGNGYGTALVLHAQAVLAAQDPPIRLCFNEIATPSGEALALKVAAATGKLMASKAEYDQARADQEGLAALQAAAETRGWVVPEP
ncbi:hypothetical protein [Nocardia sp. NPDC004860]|uniref:hypothetical protein n=1 Tax=Nocardia sp. NPDC004860 TaxID=3154557 RepID=UPI0033BC3E99